VNADGVLSSCWETAGKPGWEVGTVTDGYLAGEAVRQRWVSCGDGYRYAEDDKAMESFHDRVDAALLDYMRETGRL
jgi:uncharacterized protein